MEETIVKNGKTETNNGSTPSTGMIEQRFIRPVPPVEDGVVLEEGSVVDAYHKDGWWTGVVIKKSEDDNKFVVCFGFPPDIIEFERKQIRAHFDWTGLKWVRPEIQELSKSEFSPGTMVEVSSVMNKEEVVWFPAMIIKEIEEDDDVNEKKKKKFIVKDCNHKLYLRKCKNGYEARPNTTVDSCRVRPTPFCVEEEYKYLERVEAFRCGFGWRQGIVSAVLSDKRYMVCLEATKEESVFKHSDLRPFQVWEDGVWHNGVKESVSPVIPSPVITETPLKQTMMTEEEENSEHNSRKRKREEEEHNNSETDSTCNGSNAKINDTSVTICNDDDDVVDDQPHKARDITVLPFAKKSPFWKTCESMKGFKSVPHFSPLFDVQEDVREWSAVGMMVTFYGLLDEIKDLQLDDDSMGRLNSLSDSFAEFEKHGFDVATPQSRISKMLSLKNEQGTKAEKRKRFEKKIEEEDSERCKFEEEMAELKDKILILKRQEAAAKEKKEAAEKNIVEMKTNAKTIDREVEDMEVEFRKIVSAPWY